MLKLAQMNVNFGSIQTNLPAQIRLEIRNEQIISIEASQLKKEDVYLGKTKAEDGLVAIIENDEFPYYVHIKKNKIYCTPYLNGKTEGSLNLQVKIFHSRFKVEPTQYSYNVIDTYSGEMVELEPSVFKKGRKPFIEDAANRNGDPAIFIKFKYTDFTTFLEYTNSKKDFAFKTNVLEILTNEQLKFDFKSANELVVSKGEHRQVIRLNDLNRMKDIKLDDGFFKYIQKPIYLKLNNKFYIISYHNQKLSIKTDKEKDLLYKRSDIEFKKSGRYITLSGQIDYNAPIQPDYLMTKTGEILAAMRWDHQNHFTAKVKIKNLRQLKEIHNTIFTAINGKRFHPLFQSDKANDQRKVLLTFNTRGHAIVLRRNAANNLTFGNLPKLKIYNPWHKFKINIAQKFATIYKFFNRGRNLNVYFEKEASKAVESGKYVFEAAASNKKFKSKNVFILDKSSPQYKDMKRKWGDKVIERFSFRNYLYVFAADYFISSELSNHVVNTRIFDDKLNRKIKMTPLYFLQHGVTFLKPRDDSKNVGFHKSNMTNNIMKSVVSSDVEASIFHDMGYNDFELMKTGMPKFDNAHLIEGADKITYMPTWRPWEEAEVFNGHIEETTYYQSIMEVIEAFEKAGLIDRLQVAAHNKFSQYAKNHFNKYNDIFVEDPTDTLKNSVIYITDISSIIFDAINHGAFPIFYWKEFEDIIAKHGGTTPANRENVPGVVADDENELVEAVKSAIDNDFKLPSQVLENYRRINEFHDNQNTQRVINELINDGVLQRK